MNITINTSPGHVPGDVLMVMFCIVEFRCCVGEDRSRGCNDGDVLYCGVQVTQVLC